MQNGNSKPIMVGTVCIFRHVDALGAVIELFEPVPMYDVIGQVARKHPTRSRTSKTKASGGGGPKQTELPTK